jgi:transcriptional regulator with XRE-family HTH domain
MKHLVDEKEKISLVWRTGRLLAGKTQFELAKELDISQSSISKYETMKLEPSATDWYQFCQYVGLDAHKTLSLGYIDGKTRFKHRLFGESHFRLPLKYKRDFLLKIREIIPFKECITHELGPEKWNKFLSSHKIDHEMFYVYDFQVSLNLISDILNWCAKEGFAVLDLVSNYSSNLHNHGILCEEYARKKSASDLLRNLLENQVHYQRVFKTELHSSEKWLETSVKISPDALDFFDYRIINQFISYKIKSFQETLRINTELESDFKLTSTPHEILFSMAI